MTDKHTPSLFLTVTTDASTTRQKCGCELFRSGNPPGSVSIRLCPLHAAAPELLKALERITAAIEHNQIAAATLLAEKARAVIKAARKS